jgi:NDP-sugar pyrophosphorylase family protein
MINVVIPLSGRGARFLSAGYTVPKPLITVAGKTLIELAVTSLDLPGQHIFIVQKQHRDEYHIDDVLKKIQPQSIIIETDGVTDGPACSALLAQDYINTETELVVANCDQIMEWNSLIFLNTARYYDGCVVTYTSTNNKNSFARIDQRGLVTEMKEKQPISDIALVGIHYWRQGRHFVRSAQAMMAADDRYNGEFYIAPSYNYMIGPESRVGIYHLATQQYRPVGVPADLETYVQTVL